MLTSTQRTPTINNNQNPIWNSTFSFNVTNPETELLKIKVYDNDPLSFDDEIGEIDIPLFALHANQPKDEWYQLFPAKGGAIHLVLIPQGFGVGGGMGMPGAYGVPQQAGGYGAAGGAVAGAGKKGAFAKGAGAAGYKAGAKGGKKGFAAGAAGAVGGKAGAAGKAGFGKKGGAAGGVGVHKAGGGGSGVFG